MTGSVLIVLTYAAAAVAAAAFAWKALKLARLPVHLRWELAPVPHEKGRNRYGGSYFEEFEWWKKPREKSLANEIVYMAQEIFLLKAVWEHHRGLWWFSFPLHLGLYLLAGMGALLALGAVLSTAALAPAVRALAAAGYALGTLGALGLIARRLADPKLRPYSTGGVFFNLALLLAVFASGGAAFLSGDFAARAAAFARAWLTADLSAAVPGALAAHLLLSFLFLAVLPFTPMLHFLAKYFTYHDVRWNDEPMTPGSRMEKEVQALLRQPVTWAAPHIGADGKKNWVDIATEETKK